MEKLIIICEGETEQEFCKNILQPHLRTKGIRVYYPKIKHSGGGIVAWGTLKTQIENHLKNEPKSYVTTFIDFYGIKDSYDYPAWQTSKAIDDKFKRVEKVEQAMQQNISVDLQYRFIPYLQLHEFEALLFYRADVFYNIFEEKHMQNKKELELIFREYPNPELINNSHDNTPSHRLKRIIAGYEKNLYGNFIALEIGLSNIRSRCERFNSWIERLEK